MPPAHRVMRKQLVRDLVRTYVRGCVPGTVIKTEKLTHQLRDRNKFLSCRTVAHYLFEQDNMRRISMNTWMVIG